jgi:hypothetical protein
MTADLPFLSFACTIVNPLASEASMIIWEALLCPSVEVAKING